MIMLKPKKNEFGKWGFVDETDTWMVTPLYDSVEPYDGDYARAVVGRHHMYIDKDGKWFKEIPTDPNQEEDQFIDSPEIRSPLDILMDGFSRASDVLHRGLKDYE